MKVKILIVEDEMIIAANLAMQLEQLGYEVVATIPREGEVLPFLKQTLPDIILLDINLKGKIDGIELAILIKAEYDIPFVFLTANSDNYYFERAKAVCPYGFIAKPFKNLELQRVLELTVLRIKDEHKATETIDIEEEKSVVLNDCIFVRNNDKMLKVMLEDILYIEADRNYSNIYCKTEKHLLVATLKYLADKLKNYPFLRVHRSYIIHLKHIDEIANKHVIVNKNIIPLTADSKKELLNLINKI